ncbi:MAG: PorV/PorQ family protein [Ignavibacteriales bacterium]|nr:PorV/PorQ family protein [Ignavibacteriales bacterium]
MKRIAALSFLILLCFSLLSAQGTSSFKKVGTTGYVFLEIPVTARAAAMGDAASSSGDGVNGVFANPASITGLDGTHAIGLSYANWFADTKHEATAYAYNGGDAGVFSLSFVRLDFGEIQGTINPNPQSTGSYLVMDKFSGGAVSVGATYARRMTDRFSFGGTVKFVQEKFDVPFLPQTSYASENVLLDLGILYNTGFQTLQIGGVMRNFGMDAKYLQGIFKMPTEFRLGASIDAVGSPDADHRVTVAVEALHPSDADERFNIGIEYWFAKMIAVRGGYKINYDEEHWSVGAGVRWSLVSFDAAYGDYGRLKSVVRMSAGVTL